MKRSYNKHSKEWYGCSLPEDFHASHWIELIKYSTKIDKIGGTDE